MKHTPGPWEICKHGTPEAFPQYGVYAEGNQNDHVIVKGDNQENAEANAAFIVRACNSHYEMLEALKQYIRYMDANGMPVGDDDIRILIPSELARNARQAIEKAEGNQ